MAEAESISDRVRVHAVSALYEPIGEELSEYMKPGSTICLMGSSGAGKSTLLNALVGKEVMKTGEIREEDSKGRHTTTYRQLIQLQNGVTIIDTPGMREIGMSNVEEGIEDTFSDIVALEACCKFGNCRHETEPGCAVKRAIANGELSEERLALYQSLGSENQRNYAKKKQISKWIRQQNKFYSKRS